MIATEILLTLGYIQKLNKKYEKNEENGYFLLPSSKENIILNLARQNKVAPLIARKQMKEFWNDYKSDIEIREYKFTYYTRKAYYHHNVKSRCYSYDEEFKGTQEGIFLKGELAKKAEEVYKSYQPDCKQIYQELIEKINTVKDLIFLVLFKRISEDNCHGHSGKIIYNDFKKLLTGLNINRKVRDTLYGYDTEFSEFSVNIDKSFKKYLPQDPKSFVLLNAHMFSSSSCSLQKCLYFHQDLVEFIYEKLYNLPLEEFIRNIYLSKISEFENKYRVPLFEGKNRELQLLEKITQRRSKGKVYVFAVDAYEGELESLCEKGILMIEDEEIKEKDTDKFREYYDSLSKKEKDFLSTVTNKFIKEWLSLKIKIKGDKIVAQKRTYEGLEGYELTSTEREGNNSDQSTTSAKVIIKIQPRPDTYKEKVAYAEYNQKDKSVFVKKIDKTNKTVEKKFYSKQKDKTALSSAAGYVTGGSKNGWMFWEYYDEETREWKLIDELRKKPISYPKSKKRSKEESDFNITPHKKDSLAVYLGVDEKGSDVFWRPGALNNGHFVIVGGSGAGKTTAIRRIAYEMHKQEYPVLMIDFHEDMVGKILNVQTYKISEGSEYYFNPLELHPNFCEITPLSAASEFVEALFINFASFVFKLKALG